MKKIILKLNQKFAYNLNKIINKIQKKLYPI